jgi:hypothetical protein
MKVSDLISAYAAAVGTAALGWQVRQARRGRRTAVSVRLLTVVFGGDPEYRWRIQVTVSNRGERSTQVTQVNIRQGREVPLPAKGDGLPGVIPAGEQRSANLISSDPGAERFDPFLPIRAEIRLSSGQWIVSKRAYLGDLVGVPIDILDSLRGQPDYDTIKRAIVERIRVEGLLALYDERAGRD